MNLTLPNSLTEAYGRYCGSRFPDGPFSRKTLGRVHQRLYVFADSSIYVSSLEEYLRLVSFVFSKDNRLMFINFSGDELEQMDSIAGIYNIERSKLYSLFLSSLLFASGTCRIEVKDFFSYFMSNKPDYSYQLLITKDIYKLYSDICKNYTDLPLTALIRAAHFYYQNIAPGTLRIAESKAVTVTGESAGWRKFYIRGSRAFKNYLFGLKRETGKTINCIANNAAYQFLSAVRGLQYEK